MAVNSLAQTKIIHPASKWITYFSSQPRTMLDGLADAGFLTKQGNKYFTIVLDSAIYSDVSWHKLDINLPMRGFKMFAFRDTVAVEPYLFYCRELEIKFTAGVKKIKITPLPPMSNLNNDDLGTFFNNQKLHKSKTDREKAKKDKDKKK